jgi:GNAT superfamily N-acetyltransferase
VIPEAAWSRDLLESDRRYFEAGAEIRTVPGGVIAVLPDFERLAAGCVVQRIDTTLVAPDAAAWLFDVEGRLRSLRAPRARLYIETPDPRLDRALRERGYVPRAEYGFTRAASAAGGPGPVELIAADDENAWKARRTVLSGETLGVDGHAIEPDLWITMERRKHEAGYMRPYLIRADGRIVGAVSAAPCGSLLRMKNLVVDPAHRRRGFATATAAAFVRLAAEEGLEATGCFALEREPGLVLYPRAGYGPSATQTEWVRSLA